MLVHCRIYNDKHFFLLFSANLDYYKKDEKVVFCITIFLTFPERKPNYLHVLNHISRYFSSILFYILVHSLILNMWKSCIYLSYFKQKCCSFIILNQAWYLYIYLFTYNNTTNWIVRANCVYRAFAIYIYFCFTFDRRMCESGLSVLSFVCPSRTMLNFCLKGHLHWSCYNWVHMLIMIWRF